MLETSDLGRKCTPICSFRKYTFQYLDPLNFADVSIFFAKNQRFLSKKYSQQQCESCVTAFLVLFLGFVRQKVTVTESITFADSVPESGLRTPPNWLKIRKMTMTSQFSDTTSMSNFFDVAMVLLSSLGAGPSFMSISSLVLEL